MGYSTRFEMKWKATDTWKDVPLCEHKPPERAKFCDTCGKPNKARSVDEVVAEYIGANENMNYALESDGSALESCKWYEHLEDLAKMSIAIPGVLFHLSGEGEEAGDIWDAFAIDGKTQKHPAKVVRQERPDPKAWDTKGPSGDG